MSINAIPKNSFGLQGNFIAQSYAKPDKKTAEEKTQTAPERNQVTADEVFKHMSTAANQIQQTKTNTINVGKYVNPESAARIAASMGNFENIFSANTAAIMSEFGGKISQKTAESISLSMF